MSLLTSPGPDSCQRTQHLASSQSDHVAPCVGRDQQGRSNYATSPCVPSTLAALARYSTMQPFREIFSTTSDDRDRLFDLSNRELQHRWRCVCDFSCCMQLLRCLLGPVYVHWGASCVANSHEYEYSQSCPYCIICIVSYLPIAS